ncbi:MAG TPA: helix-turn-helix transcriptional regulator [Pyrinomonadaceae bacterium]|nr:helix-turn-helix transcriptional regulator [Pyrinomonadaceae bacterium]
MSTARQRAERLPGKLLQIRLTLGLSQSQMLRRLEAEDMVLYQRISEYERGEREPPLPILLRYARVAGVNTEALIDDDLDLPDKIPGPTDHQQIKRRYTPRRRP